MLTTPALTYESYSDEALCQLYGETGEVSIISELYLRYGHLVYGACLKYLKDKEESEDVVSVIFEKLMQKIPDSNVLNFNSWLYSVIHSECGMRLRRQKVLAKIKHSIQQSDKNNGTFTPDYAAEAQLGTTLTLPPVANEEELVIEAIKLLGEEQQTCIQLFFFGGHSYQQIVKATGYSDKQVKSYLQNGKRKIRQFVESYRRPIYE